MLPRCDSLIRDGQARPLGEAEREAAARAVADVRRAGAFGSWRWPSDASNPATTFPSTVSRPSGTCAFLGLVAMLDPPRPEVADAVRRCHRAGIRIIVITGDHGLTAAAVAREVGITGDRPTVITGEQLERIGDTELDALLRSERELIFARSSPEAKLRIAESLRAEGLVVAMTGDGVNDAPALRRADIGVAMGRSGTDVAREAATMVLTDDNFATIVTAVAAGRRVYDNVRKFIFYIFAHATPEVTPFLVFALGGGAIPLPLTVLQLLAFDVGTETLPGARARPRAGRAGNHAAAAARPIRGRDPAPDAGPGLALPRPDLRGPSDGRVLLRPRSGPAGRPATRPGRAPPFTTPTSRRRR